MIKFLKTILFIDIIKGLLLTLKHFFMLRGVRGETTIEYPYKRRFLFQKIPQQKPLPEGYRGLLCLRRKDDGSERCVGCALCEAYCPSKCITVVSAEKENEPLQRYARFYQIDITRCVFCGYCVDACPVEALAMTKRFELSQYEKNTIAMTKEKLLEVGDIEYPCLPVRQTGGKE
ncbi:MAG: NADH-quinone oxidoreductase subunit I [Nitrospirae bacterium]|nr:NADH-quinone oxidoreductase subunit I [Nitrospirota bacterium]